MEIIPGTFEQDVDPSSTWVDVVYAQHLLDLYNSGEIANAAVFPSVLGAQTGDPRDRYSDTALRPWFVVFDGDAGTWVNDGDTQWYDTNHYLVVVTDAYERLARAQRHRPGAGRRPGPGRRAGRGRRLVRVHRLEHRARQRRAERRAAPWLTGGACSARCSVPAATLLALLAPAAAAAGAATLVTDPAALVNPFIGTGSNGDFTAGNTFPGADVPHGMLQWSPDTTSRPSGGGYDYADSAITGFSLTHVDGTGCAAAGDVPILPVTGALGSDPGSDSESFSHSDESASPGYYSVALGNGTSVALTTTTHAGIGQFTFPATTSASLLLKLDDPATPYAASTLSTVGDDELTGSVTSTGFCEATNNFTLYFAIEFSQPFTASGTYGTTSAGPGGAYATFDTTAGQTVTARGRHLLHLGHRSPGQPGRRGRRADVRPGRGGGPGAVDGRT